MAVGAAVILGLGEGHNVRDLEVAELHALDGITVAGFAIAQGGAAAAQHIVYAGLVEHTGGHIGGIPHAVLFGIGQAILVDGQGAGSGFINGGILQLGGRHGKRNRKSHHDGKAHCKKLFDRFHCNCPHFVFVCGMKIARG